MARDVHPEAIARLGSLAVKQYLLAQGWERVPGRRPDVGIFRRPGSEDTEVLLPLRDDFPDALAAMARAVEEIATYEARPASQVLRDLTSPRVDLMRLVVESPESASGGIGLEDALALLSGSKKALLAAACSVKRPQRFHPRMSLREAEAFVRACRFGHTEQGSFVVTLQCALEMEGGEPISTAGDSASAPFGRKVTTLLIGSIARVVNAIRTDDLRALTDPGPGDPVVSSNLCDAVVEMMPSPPDAALRIWLTWSPVLPVPSDVPKMVRIERQYRSAIEQVAATLRPAARQLPDLFVGKLDALQGQPGADGRIQGDVLLLVPVEDEILRIRLELGPEDYAAACDAHRDGLYVSVQGILHRGARLHRLEQTSGFTVMRR